MNKMIFKKAGQLLLCVITWATFSPLFCRVARRSGLITKRWVRVLMLFLSPLFLFSYCVLYVIGAFTAYYVYDTYLVKYHYADNEVIENITGASFPEMEIKKYVRGERSFTGDYGDMMVLKMKEKPGKELIQELDSLERADTHWVKEGNEYRHDWTWGGGTPVPKGEKGHFGHFFSLSYTTGSDSLIVTYGAW